MSHLFYSKNSYIHLKKSTEKIIFNWKRNFVPFFINPQPCKTDPESCFETHTIVEQFKTLTLDVNTLSWYFWWITIVRIAEHCWYSFNDLKPHHRTLVIDFSSTHYSYGEYLQIANWKVPPPHNSLPWGEVHYSIVFIFLCNLKLADFSWENCFKNIPTETKLRKERKFPKRFFQLLCSLIGLFQ